MNCRMYLSRNKLGWKLKTQPQRSSYPEHIWETHLLCFHLISDSEFPLSMEREILNAYCNDRGKTWKGENK
jgi:hypothetical protein